MYIYIYIYIDIYIYIYVCTHYDALWMILNSETCVSLEGKVPIYLEGTKGVPRKGL